MFGNPFFSATPGGPSPYANVGNPFAFQGLDQFLLTTGSGSGVSSPSRLSFGGSLPSGDPLMLFRQQVQDMRQRGITLDHPAPLHTARNVWDA